MSDPRSRRRYLRLAAAAGTLGVAGCSQRPSAGGSGSGDPGTGTTTTPSFDRVDDRQFAPDDVAESGTTGGSAGGGNATRTAQATSA